MAVWGRIGRVEVDSKELLSDAKMVSGKKLNFVTDAEKAAVRRTKVDEHEGHALPRASRCARTSLNADGSVPTREERILREHDISRLSSEHGLYLPNVKDVAGDPLDGTLRKASVPWSCRRAKQERSMLRGGTEPHFVNKFESQDLLTDEYQILVLKRN